MRYLGSNQFVEKNKTTILGVTLKDKSWVSINVVCMILLPVIYFGNQTAQAEAKGRAGYTHSPIAEVPYSFSENHPYVKFATVDTPQKREIIAYVKEVFGDHADKAFAVLGCENSALNPKVVNTAGNTPVGSADVGLFQINDYWQKVGNRAFLTDYKINTQIAWNIYQANGYSFERWTCGRKLNL